MSLDERAASFMNVFSSKVLTGGRLYHLFVKHKVRYKVIRTIKMVPPHRAHVIPQ